MRKHFDKLYKESFIDFVKIINSNIIKNKKMFIVTANPETLMISSKNKDFKNILSSKNVTIVPDGISLVKAGRFLKYDIKERIPGIEIVEETLFLLNEQGKSIYLYGSKEDVISDAVKNIEKKYKNIKVLGYKNGYDYDDEVVFKDILKKKPDFIMVALGIPKQELIISKYYDKFDKGIFIGVGGTFDVLSGHKKRAPIIFRKANLEWLYRILKEPKRIRRFYNNNLLFVIELLKIKGDKNEK